MWLVEDCLEHYLHAILKLLLEAFPTGTSSTITSCEIDPVKIDPVTTIKYFMFSPAISSVDKRLFHSLADSRFRKKQVNNYSHFLASLESLKGRLPGEIPVTSYMKMTPPLWQKVKKK